MVISIGTHAIINLNGLPDDKLKNLIESLEKRLIFQNPRWVEAKKAGRYTGNIEEYLKFMVQRNNQIIVPRGFTGSLIKMLKTLKIPYKIDDRRRSLPPVDFRFNGKLKSFQERVVNTAIKKDFGVICAPTGAGKTVLALNLVAKRKQPTLIIVHTKELMYQWVDRIFTFLGIPKQSIGMIGDGKKSLKPRITVGIYKSIKSPKIAQHIGHLIVDECHRVPARTFTQVVKLFDSKYLLGLSATPYRRDGLTKVIYFSMGDLSSKVDYDKLFSSGDIIKPEVVIHKTSFESRYKNPDLYTYMLNDLSKDLERNKHIARCVMNTRNGNGITLVACERVEQCTNISRLLKNNCLVLTGRMSRKEREKVIPMIGKGDKGKVIIATVNLVGEGFDCPEINNIFLASPVSFEGRLLQVIGRGLRVTEDKKNAVVHDIVDPKMPILMSQFQRRLSVYKKFMLKIQNL